LLAALEAVDLVRHPTPDPMIRGQKRIATELRRLVVELIRTAAAALSQMPHAYMLAAGWPTSGKESS
jgi:hypothetical protein